MVRKCSDLMNKQKIEKSSKNENLMQYETLAPTKSVRYGKEYIKALDWALKQENIRNIALSGPYGSGKSSVIETYLQETGRGDTARISLAAFNLADKQDNDSNPNLISDLETGILKQLFYSVDAKKIPQSRYRKLQPISEKENFFIAIIIIFFIYCLLKFLLPNEVLSVTNSLFTNNLLFDLIEFIGLFVLVLFSLYFAIGWIRKNISIKEINLLDKATLSNESCKGESIFNKNMDEIVYFFQVTGKKLVVIEDLDRYGNSDIFVALRELNTILNNNELINGSIKFLYTIRDDMFTNDEERTKFFDFIIPIIPYISSDNSNDILRERLFFDEKNNRSKTYNVSGRFVSMISPYISDPRELACICNEFQIYKKTLIGNQALDLDDEKMLALIVFKNRYPKDFADLEDEKESSIVLEAFKNKTFLANNEGKLIEKKRNEEKEKIGKIENEAMHSVRELKTVLLSALTNFQYAINSITIDGTNYTFSSLLKDDFDINSLKNKNITILYWNSGNNSRRTISNVEEEIKQLGENYFDRIDAIINGVKNLKEDSRKRIEEYETLIKNVRTYSIKKVIEVFGTDFLNDKVIENDLLVFLLRNGYLDETYINYINYFHPNSISREEMNFILGVRNRRFDKDYSYYLINVEQVFDRLQDFEFGLKEILNYNLIDYVLVNKADSGAFRYLFRQLSDRSTSSKSFIKSYILRDTSNQVFLKNLCCVNKYLWMDLCDDDGLSEESLLVILSSILKWANYSDILEMNVESTKENKCVLTSFIESSENVLKKLNEFPCDFVIQLLDDLDVIFEQVDLDSVDDNIKQFIYDNNRYSLNPYMIKQLFIWKKPSDVSKLDLKNYTTILDFEYMRLKEYVDGYFVEYAKNVMLALESNTHEEKNAVRKAVDNLAPDHVDVAIEILKKNKIIWTDLNDCCSRDNEESIDSVKQIWDFVLINNQMSCSWKNMSIYFDLFGLTPSCKSFFEEHIDELLQTVSSDVPSLELKYAIVLADLSAEDAEKCIVKFDLPPYEGDISTFGEKKICMMIDQGLIPFSLENWKKLKQLAPNYRTKYVYLHPIEFMKFINDLELDESEYTELLLSDSFNSNEKQEILKRIPAENMTDQIANMLSTIDLTIDIERFKSAYKLLSIEGKKKLLLKHIYSIENDELPAFFSDLGGEYIQLVDRSKHKFHISFSEYNEKLLEALSRKEYITSLNDEWESNSEGAGKDDIHVLTGFVKLSLEKE